MLRAKIGAHGMVTQDATAMNPLGRKRECRRGSVWEDIPIIANETNICVNVDAGRDLVKSTFGPNILVSM